MNIVHKLSEEQITQLHRLYQEEWWTRGRSLEDTKQCVLGSQICIGLVATNGDLIGFVRVLTDYTFKALIFDVIVAQCERGKGLGSRLLHLVKHHEQLRAVKHFELYCTADMFSFYENHGFSANLGEIKLMRLINA